MAAMQSGDADNPPGHRHRVDSEEAVNRAVGPSAPYENGQPSKNSRETGE